MDEKIDCLTLEEMERGLDQEIYLQDNILGMDGETQDYIFYTKGGRKNWWRESVWKKLFPEKFAIPNNYIILRKQGDKK